MIDKHVMESAFEDWYKELWTRTSLADFLAGRLDKFMFACYKAAWTRAYAEGLQEGLQRVQQRRRRLEEASLAPAPRQQEQRESQEVVTSRNAAGTAQATHIPIVIEGTIELDRNRPVGEYTGEEE